MKMLFVALSVVLGIMACNTPAVEPAHNIVGKWDAKDNFNGAPFEFVARFKPDGTYDALGNGKLIVSGLYRTTGDTIFFKDAICNIDFEASYKMTYFQDSVKFDKIYDTCRQRIEGSDKVTLRKVTM